jgi:hypothetical protein
VQIPAARHANVILIAANGDRSAAAARGAAFNSLIKPLSSAFQGKQIEQPHGKPLFIEPR